MKMKAFYVSDSRPGGRFYFSPLTDSDLCGGGWFEVPDSDFLELEYGDVVFMPLDFTCIFLSLSKFESYPVERLTNSVNY